MEKQDPGIKREDELRRPAEWIPQAEEEEEEAMSRKDPRHDAVMKMWL